MCDKCQKDQKIAELSDALAREKYRADEWSRLSVAKAKQAEAKAEELEKAKAQIARLDKTLQGAVMWGGSIIEILAELRETAVQAVIGAPVDENVINLLAAAGRADDMLDTMAEIIESEQEAI